MVTKSSKCLFFRDFFPVNPFQLDYFCSKMDDSFMVNAFFLFTLHIEG